MKCAWHKRHKKSLEDFGLKTRQVLKGFGKDVFTAF